MIGLGSYKKLKHVLRLCHIYIISYNSSAEFISLVVFFVFCHFSCICATAIVCITLERGRNDIVAVIAGAVCKVSV